MRDNLTATSRDPGAREDLAAEAVLGVPKVGPAPVHPVLELQRHYGNRLVARALAEAAEERAVGPRPWLRRRVTTRPALARRVLQRAQFTVGRLTVQVDYGGLQTVAHPAAEIEARSRAFTGRALAAGQRTALRALARPAQRWVLHGVRLLERNAAAAPNLDRAAAVRRLISHARSAASSPYTPGWGFENEVLRVSGWFEIALAAPLRAPSGSALTTITGLYNPPSMSSSARGLDAARLAAELAPALTTVLNSRDPARWTNVGAVPLATLQTLADQIQSEARTFFAPYADRAMSTPFATGWRYSTQLFSVTAMTPMQPQRISYLLNRAELVGRMTRPGGSIFARSNFDSGDSAHRAALLSIVTAMEADPAIAPVVDRLIRHTGRTSRSPLRVGISTEWNRDAASECVKRWDDIDTLCHELCHALVHPAFPARASSIRFGQIVREGFSEVLGVQLHSHLRRRAASDPGFKRRMEAGVTGAPCPAPAAATVGYEQAGANAATIRSSVGDDNFRAAYFLGAVRLVGL